MMAEHEHPSELASPKLRLVDPERPAHEQSMRWQYAPTSQTEVISQQSPSKVQKEGFYHEYFPSEKSGEPQRKSGRLKIGLPLILTRIPIVNVLGKIKFPNKLRNKDS